MIPGPRAGDVGRIKRNLALIWVLGAAVATMSGLLVVGMSTARMAAILAVGLVILVFLWREEEPMVPFLLLVAGMQGGVLLQLPLGDAPITTVMPLLGAWTLAAVLIGRARSVAPVRPSTPRGSRLTLAVVSLGVVVTATSLGQAWRPDGHVLTLTETGTLIQLAILVAVSAHLLSSPQRVIVMGYVIVGVAGLVSLVALMESGGLVTLGTEKEYVEGYTRVSGLMRDPNYFAFQQLTAIAFAAHLGLSARSLWKRITIWCLFGIILTSVVMTYSAGAVLGLAAAVGAVLLLQFKVSTRSAALALVALVIVTIGVVLIAPSSYTQAVSQKYSQLSDMPFEQMGTYRGATWTAAAREIGDNPLLGVGASTFGEHTALAPYFTPWRLNEIAAHNTYLAVAVMSGVVALAAFLVALGASFSVLWHAHSRAARSEQRDVRVASACLFSALVVFAIQGLLLDLQLEKYLWLLLGACIAARSWPIAHEDASS